MDLVTPVSFIEESDGYWVPLNPAGVGFIQQKLVNCSRHILRSMVIWMIMYEEFSSVILLASSIL